MSLSQDIIEKLKNLLDDEFRILTYKYVSHRFNLHVNQAKCYLEAVLRSMTNCTDAEPIYAMYFICGRPLDSDHTMQVKLVSGDQLDSCLSQMKPVLCQHIYSVQRKAPLNTNALYGADAQEGLFDSPLDGSLCAIRHDTVRVLSQSERKPAKTEAAAVAGGGEATAAAASAVKTPPVNKSSSSSTVVTDPKPTVKTERDEKDAPPTTGDVTGSKNERNDHSAATYAKKTTTNAKNNKKGGIASMFAQANKAATAKKADSTSDRSEVAAAAAAAAVVVCKSEKAASVEKSPEKSAHVAVRFGRGKRAAVDKRSGAGAAGGGAARAGQQKRRRVMAVVSSSDSSDSEASHQGPAASDPEHSGGENEQPEHTPVCQQADVKQQQPVSPHPPCNDAAKSVSENGSTRSGRKRTRKLVDKTFVDDEGFMVTKKVYENVSESDDEKPSTVELTKCPSPASPAAPAAHKCSSSVTSSVAAGDAAGAPKTKQANIMNFFKRK